MLKPKKITLGPRPKEKYGLAFFLAFLAACALFIPYMVQDQGYFLFYGDFNVQQVPFYKLAHAAVREGAFGWSFGTDLGANFIGSYSFYLLGSPFFWLTLPFPTDFVPYLMGPLLILKFACASLTAYAFITRFVHNKTYGVMGGLLYAFSGFSVYNIFFNHFHEAIILFPLLLLSLEWLMCKEHYAPFIFMVALCAVSNYYFFFGMALFTVIYFICRVFSPGWDLFQNSACLKRDLGRVGLVVAEAVLGLLLSAFMLVPAILAITGNTRIDSFLTGWNGIVYSRSQIYSYILQCFFFPPDLPARPVFFPEADVKWSSVAGWLPVFGMTGVLSFLAAHKGSWLKRITVTCAIIAFVPIFNSAFSAFNYSYYARWFYMPLLLFALMTAMGLEDKTVNWKIGWRWSLGITAFFLVAVGLFPQGQYADGTFSGFGLYTEGYEDRFLVTAAIAMVCLLLVPALYGLKKHWPKDFARVSVVLILVVSVVYSSYFVGMGKQSSYDTNGFMIPNLIEGYDDMTLKNAYGVEEPTYEIDDVRTDVYEGMDNVAMFFGMSGINAFHSIVPGSVMEFYDFVGVERTVATRPSTEDYALRGLLSVKYIFDYADDTKQFADEYGNPQMQGYSLLENGEDNTQNGYYIYENDSFVPYGFTYDYYTTKQQCEDLSQESRVDMMMEAIVLDEEQINKYGHLMTNAAESGLDYSVDLNLPRYFQNCRKRAATACSSFETHGKGFTAKTTLEKDNLVFFSIPYDAGWRATVDGVPVPVEKVNVGFMAVPVQGDGVEHTIEFTYHTPGLLLGFLVSGGALVATLLFLFLVKKRGNQEPLTDTFIPAEVPEELPVDEEVPLLEETELQTPYNEQEEQE